MNELTQRGIAALKAGDRTTARKLLASAVQQDANDITAWLWLAGALDGDEERITCLQQVLRIDPGNQAAARGLAQILERRTRPASMAAAAQPPAAKPPAAAQPVAPALAEPPAVSKPAAAPPPEPPAPSNPAITFTPEPPAPVKPASSESAETTTPDAWRGLTWDAAPAETSAAEAPQTETPVSPVFVEDTNSAVGQAQIYEEPAPYEATPAQATPAQATPEAYDWNAAAAAATGRAAAARAASSTSASAPATANAEAPAAVDMDALAAFAAPAQPAAPGSAEGVPYQRKRSKESYLPMRRIFTTRPSMVPALLCFWLFFFGAVISGNLLAKNEPMKTQITIVPQALMENPVKVQASSAFAMAMGLILELVVLYAVLRIFTIRYELTNQTLTLRFRGKRARVPVEYIYNAECKQSFIQTMIGTGHLDLDLAVNGELAHIRLRDIPDCNKRKDQIMYLVQDQA